MNVNKAEMMAYAEQERRNAQIAHKKKHDKIDNNLKIEAGKQGDIAGESYEVGYNDGFEAGKKWKEKKAK